MTVRKRHGKGALYGAGPVVETLPVDELPRGVQAPEVATAGRERDERGRFLPGARRAQAAGGRARKNRTRLAAQLGISDLAEAGDFRPYLEAAEDFIRTQSGYLAAQFAAGELPPDAGAIVVQAAWKLAAAACLNARAVRDDDVKLFERARRLGDSGRQDLLAARELAAKAGQASRNRRGPAPLQIPSSTSSAGKGGA